MRDDRSEYKHTRKSEIECNAFWKCNWHCRISYSVIQRQIANGGPVIVTDKRIIRYFMTIPEASQLVHQRGAIANNGELFILDMG